MQAYRNIQEKEMARISANSTRAFAENFMSKVIGLGLLWWGHNEYQSAIKTDGRFDEWVALAVGVAGLYFVMPAVVKSLFGLVKPVLPWYKGDTKVVVEK